MNAHGSYFASLSLQLKAKHGDLFDAQLFAPLLASVVAHEKNIIIRTVEEDITRVCNAASHMLSAIFGLSAHRVNTFKHSRRRRINADTSPLIDSLFMSPSPLLSEQVHRRSSPSISRRRAAQNLHASPSLEVRALSSGTIAGTKIPPKPLSVSSQHIRSISAGSFSAPAAWESPFNDAQDIAPLFSGKDHPPALRSSSPERGVIVGSIEPSQISFLPTTSTQRVTSTEGIDIPKSPTSIRLPDVILFTKLEKASPSDHEALAEMLRTRKAVSPRPDDEGESEVSLHPGFFIISVCGIGNGKTCPEMPSYLLDEFSFSSTVLLDPSFPSSRPRVPSLSPSITLAEIEQFRSQCLQASRLLSESSQDSPRTFISPHLQIYIQNLLSAARHHPSLQGNLISAHCAQDLEDFTRVARVIFGSQAPSKGSDQIVSLRSGKLPPNTLDCVEMDVARVFASVVGHRLATRRQVCGPLSSMVRTAVFLPDENDMTRQGLEDIQPKETINSVLAEILGKV